MQLPTLRRPVGASVAGRRPRGRSRGLRCCPARRRGRPVFVLALGLYGAAALLPAGSRRWWWPGSRRPATRMGDAARRAGPRPRGGGRDPGRRRRRRWSSRSSPPRVSGCSWARCPARSWPRSRRRAGRDRRGARRGGRDRQLAAAAPDRAAPCPARARSARPAPADRRWRRRACWRSWRRCRAPTGACWISDRCTRWRRRSCSATAHGLFWFGSAPGRALRRACRAVVGARCRSRSPSRRSPAWSSGARLPEGAPVFARRRRRRVGAARCCSAPRAASPTATATGFRRGSAAATATIARGDVYPGAEDVPGDGVDENCEGGDAKASAAAADRRPPRPPTPRPRPRARTPSRATCSSSRSTPAGRSAGRRRLRPPAGQVAHPDARRAGPQGKLISAGSGRRRPNTPQVVPVDPDRPLSVGHRVGQAGHQLPEPAAVQPDLLREAGRRAG